MSEIIYFAIPAFLLTMVIEFVLIRRRAAASGQVLGYELKDSLASISMGLGELFVAALTKVPMLAFMFWIYEHRVFDLGDEWWMWLVVIPAEDHSYYWYHRVSHEVRLSWSSHINHHSSQRYNLSTAVRQAWLAPILAPIFWVPLPLIGLKPEMIMLAQGINLLYQYWIHTELIDRLGPLEWVFNSPSHHRVHHAKNAIYLDRNYAGIFIIWDRLYGSFQAELREEPVRYGLTKDIASYNPVYIAFHELVAMLRDVAGARSLRGVLGYLFGRPGWREDGMGKTSVELRADYLAERTPRPMIAPMSPIAPAE